MDRSELSDILSRRAFMATITGAAAMALIGYERRAFAGASPNKDLLTDYIGRLCYNENPLGPSPLALEAIRDNAGMAHRYPDWYAESLKAVLASHYDLSSGHIICGAGATEILRLCAMALTQPGGNVVVPYPSYGQFPVDSELFGSSVKYVCLDADYRVDFQNVIDNVDEDTTAVCITNPNNPTATVVNPKELTDFVDNLPTHVVTVIDEAYLEYISNSLTPWSFKSYPTAIDLVRSGQNVVVVKTFSKVYGLAGARIGYAVGPTAIISSMRASQIYATISRPSLEAAKASLNDESHVMNTIKLAQVTKEYCFHQLDQMGLEYIPSQTSFFMVDVGREADPVRAQLAQRGIYVRTGWGMPNHLRVSTGTKQEMIDFIEALAEILGGIRDPLANVNDADMPASFELYQAYPNPFNSSTSIRVLLPMSAPLKLEIFNIRGRVVKILVNGTMGAGEHSFIWNGTNQSGHSVSSGSYFYRLTSGGNVVTKKMLLVK
jgi:histidinol-phosphate aminotransferase